MSETLKPCPFCGDQPIEWNDDGGSPEGYATVSCENINCGEALISRKLRGGFIVDPEPHEETWRIVRERWNTRADDNRWRSVAEQAEKALRNIIGQDGPGLPHGTCATTAQEALAAFDSLRKEGKQ